MEEYKTVTKPEKKKLSKKKLILCVLAVLIVGGVAIHFITTAHRNISQELLKDESQTVLDYMNAMGAKYGISFTKVTMERDEYPRIYAYSANYAAASNKDKLDLLVRIDDDLGYTGTLELADGTKLKMTWGVWSDLYIVSGGHEYSLYDKRNSTGYAELMSGYETVISVKYKETYHAKDKDNKPSQSGSGSVVCPSCGKKVSKLISKKDAAGVVRNWCSSCWADYNAIMGG